MSSALKFVSQENLAYTLTKLKLALDGLYLTADSGDFANKLDIDFADNTGGKVVGKLAFDQLQEDVSEDETPDMQDINEVDLVQHLVDVATGSVTQVPLHLVSANDALTINASGDTLTFSVADLISDIGDLNTLLATKQDKLTAGANIVIGEGNVISVNDIVIYKIVTDLPDDDIDDSKIYLMTKTVGSKEVFFQYIYVDDEWHEIGELELALENYYTKSQLYTKTETNALLTDKLDKATFEAIDGELVGDWSVSQVNTLVDESTPEERTVTSVKIVKTVLDLSSGTSVDTNYIIKSSDESILITCASGVIDMKVDKITDLTEGEIDLMLVNAGF